MSNDTEHFSCANLSSILLWLSVCSNIFPILNRLFILLSFKVFVYSEYKSSISDKMWFANTFFQSMAYLFFFLMISLKVCNFYEIQFFSFFSFMDLAFGVISKKSLPDPKSQLFSPVFSSRIFIALAVTFKSVIHFNLISVHDVR